MMTLPCRKARLEPTCAALLALVLAGCATTRSDPTSSMWADAARVLAPADTFSILMNGQAIGSQVVTVQQSAAGYRFTETTSVGGGTQTTEVLLTPSLQMRQVTQRGTMAGQDMRIDVEYAAGRATGTARTPGPQGMTERAVDAAVPPDVIDDNVLAAVLPALDWHDGATWQLNVFHSGRNVLAAQTLRVTGRSDVQLRGGSRAAYRAELSGGETPLVFHISTAAPHQLLRIEVTGTPMEVVRVN